MIEKDIEKLLTEKVKELGGVAYKFVSPGHAGVPDRLIVIPGGEVVFVELKAPGKKERALQVQEQERLKALGVRVFSTVDSAEKVAEICRFLKRVKG